MPISPSEAEQRQLFSSRDGLDSQSHFFFSYRITPSRGVSLDETAVQIALVISARTMIISSTEDSRHRVAKAAKVISTDRVTGNVVIALPAVHCTRREGVPHLLSLATTPAEYSYASSIWLDNIEVPKDFADTYAGPRFGVPGIRKIFGVSKRPLLGLVIKPRVGSTLAALGRVSREAIFGGVDFLVDDLLMVDPPEPLSFRSRLNYFSTLVAEETIKQRRAIKYFVNISADGTRPISWTAAAKNAGAAGVVINPFCTGFGMLNEVVKQADRHLIVIATNMGSGMMSRATFTQSANAPADGVSEAIFSKLSRLVGSDAVHAGTSASECYGTTAWGPASRALSVQLHGQHTAMAVAEGDITLGNLWDNINSLGLDILVEATNGILNAPGGAREGAEAMRAALDVLRPSMSKQEADQALLALGARQVSVRNVLRQLQWTPSFKV